VGIMPVGVRLMMSFNFAFPVTEYYTLSY
jgi:hypothetical protein